MTGSHNWRSAGSVIQRFTKGGGTPRVRLKKTSNRKKRRAKAERRAEAKRRADMVQRKKGAEPSGSTRTAPKPKKKNLTWTLAEKLFLGRPHT